MKEQLQKIINNLRGTGDELYGMHDDNRNCYRTIAMDLEAILNPPHEPRPSKQERRQQFIADLKALLVKYHAEIESENLWRGYAECGQDLQLTVSLDAVPGDDGSYAGKQEWDYFKLGYSVDYTDDIEAKDN